MSAVFAEVCFARVASVQTLWPGVESRRNVLERGERELGQRNLSHRSRRLAVCLRQHPALEAAGVPPRRIYDLRSTFASNALAAGVSVFELARIMGTSVRMIERHYGTLLQGSGDAIRGKLDAYLGRLGQESAMSTAVDGASET